MKNQLSEYPKYIESGIPWLGRVPEHWHVLPGRACLKEKKVPNKGMQEKTVLSLSYGKLVVKPEEKLHGLVPESFETYQIVEPGDIIFRPTDLQNDWNSLRFGISRSRGIITSAYMCLQAQECLTKEYAHLLLHSYDLKKIFYGLGSGLRQNIDWRDFKYLPCLVPPLHEQAAIVRFLDHVDRRIKRYIRSKQKLIRLLNEQKQAIIHQAVTRGLDPNVRLKPSGVDWLGDMPGHWKLFRLRNVANLIVSNVDKHIKENESHIQLCNYVDVYKNDRITASLNFMVATATDEEINRFRLMMGDVLITKDSEIWNDIGVPALVEYVADDLLCGYHLAILRPKIEIIVGPYLFRAFQSKAIATQLHISANGITRYGLSQHAIKDMLLVVPPLDEQQQIVAYLDVELSGIESTINSYRVEINLLKEYQTRLISNVVTGKIDVREATAQLPEELDEIDSLNEEPLVGEEEQDDLDIIAEEG